MKRWLAAVIFLPGILVGAGPCLGEPVSVEASQITHFAGVIAGAPVGSVVWQGGLDLKSDVSEFSELSGVTFPYGDGRFVAVSDKGYFASGALVRDADGHLKAVAGAQLDPIQNSGGDELPRAFARDAEGIDTIYRDGGAVAVRVSFEHLTRVADFDLQNGRPGGPARPVLIPDWLTEMRNNKALESLCVAPSASPVAGSTLLIVEGAQPDGTHRSYLIGNKDRGDLILAGTPGMSPTDCAFLPNGDLLVLERGTVLISFITQVRRIPAAEVHKGSTMHGDVILFGSGGDIDNMEGIAVYPGPDGAERMVLVSDNNQNSWERTLFLEFSFP